MAPRCISAGMLTKNDFSSAEWTTLRDTPFLVGFATLLAGSSGLGTFKELFALSQGIMQNQSSPIALIRDLTGMGEMQAAQASIKQSLGSQSEKPSPENVRQAAIRQVRSAMGTLAAHGATEETEAYRRMLYGVAEKVANAAREGGFLGFGGTVVSEGERSFLNELGTTLQLEQVRRA